MRPVAVEAVGAAVSLGGRTVWKDLDVRVDRGSFTAVLGPNGVGKSTLLRAVLGLQPLAAGRLTVLGAPPGRARARIGYLPQRRSFDPALRVRGVDVVRLGLDGTRWGVPLPFAGPGRRVRDERRRVAAALDRVGASRYARRPVGQVSGGEQQRLLIAQALVRSPELLLLDEPLDSLDITNQGSVAALVQSVCRQEGVTVIMVAHDVNPILAYVDRVVYLATSGAVSGAPQDVITGPTLSRLFDTPIEVLTTSDGRLVVVGQPEPPAVHSDRHAP
jgi:zinc/manganese transport system ATP-binding protein